MKSTLPVTSLTAILICQLLTTVLTYAQDTVCLPNDVFTAFGGGSNDVTDIAVAAYEQDLDIKRVFFASTLVDDTDPDNVIMNSFMSYIDMLTCEVYFQIKETGGAYDHGLAVTVQPPADSIDDYGERLYFLGSKTHPEIRTLYDYQIIVKELSVRTGIMEQISFDFCCGNFNENTRIDHHETKREIYFMNVRGLTIINFDRSEIKQVILAANYQVQSYIYKHEKLFYFFGNKNINPNVILLTTKFQWNGWNGDPSYLQRNHDYIQQSGYYPSTLKAKMAYKESFDYETVTALCLNKDGETAHKLGAIVAERGFYWYQEDGIRGCVDIDIDLQGSSAVNVNYLVLQRSTNQLRVFSMIFTFQGSSSVQKKSITVAQQTLSQLNDMEATNFRVFKAPGAFNWFVAFHGNMRENLKYGDAEIGFVLGTQGSNRYSEFWYPSNQYSVSETQTRTYGGRTADNQINNQQGETEPILDGFKLNFNDTESLETLNDWIFKFCVDQEYAVKRFDFQIPADNDTFIELPYEELLFDIDGTPVQQALANPWYKTCYPKVQVDPDRKDSIDIREVKPMPDNIAVINVTEKVFQRVFVERVSLFHEYSPSSFYLEMLNYLTPEEDPARRFFIEVKNRAPYLDPLPQRVSFIRVGQRADKFVWETTYLKDDDGDNIFASFRNYPDFLVPKYDNQFLFTSRKIEKSDEGLYKIDYILIDDAETKGLQPASKVYELIVIVTLSGYIEEEPEIVRQEEPTEVQQVEEEEVDSFVEWVEFTPIAERPPKVNVTPINAKGEFQINFSKPLRIPDNFDDLSRDSVYFYDLLSAKLEAQAERERIAARRGFARLLQGNWEGFSDYEGEDISEDDEPKEEVLEEREKVVLYEPLIQVQLEPGYTEETSESELALLQQPIDWEITDFASYKIAIKINFDSPEIVSQIQGAPDKIKVVLNLEDFADPYGLRVYNGTTIEKYLPTQVSNEHHLYVLELLSEISLYTILGAVFLCYLAFYFSKSSLVLVWTLFNSIQLVSHLPLLSINVPANLGYFNSQLALLGRLQVLIVGYGSDFLFGYLFDFEQTKAWSVQFEQTGYTSLYAIPNLGTIMILVVIFVPTFLVVYSILLVGSRCSIFVEHYYWIVKNNFIWGFFQRFTTMTFLVFVVSALINSYNMSVANWSHALQLAIVFYVYAVFFTMPFHVLAFYALKYSKLDEKDFKMRWGSIYAGHKSGKEKTRWSVIWASWFYARRILFAVLVVTLKEHMLLQLYLMIALTLVNGMVFCQCKPYQDKAAFRLELLGELTLMVLCYHMMIFSGMLPQNWLRYIFGWTYIGVALSSFLVHAVYMIMRAFIDARHMIRRKIYLYKQKQVMLAFIKEMSKPNMIFVSAPKILNQTQVVPSSDADDLEKTDRDDSQRVPMNKNLDAIAEEEEKEELKEEGDLHQQRLPSSGEGGRNRSRDMMSGFGADQKETTDRPNFDIGNLGGGYGGMNAESEESEQKVSAFPSIGIEKKNLSGINDMLRMTHMGMTWNAGAPTELNNSKDPGPKQNVLQQSQEQNESNFSSNKFLLPPSKLESSSDQGIIDLPSGKNSSMEYTMGSTVQLKNASTALDQPNISPDPIGYSVAMPAPELVSAFQTGAVAITDDASGRKQFIAVDQKITEDKLEVSENDIEEVEDTSRMDPHTNRSGRVEMQTLDKSDMDKSASDTLTPRLNVKDIEAPDAFYPVAKAAKKTKTSSHVPDAMVYESSKQAAFQDEHMADLNEGIGLRESFGNVQKQPTNVFATPGRVAPSVNWTIGSSGQKSNNVQVLGSGLAAREVQDAQFMGNVINEDRQAKKNTKKTRQAAANMFLMAEDSDKGVSSDSDFDMGPMPIRQSANFNNAGEASGGGSELPNIYGSPGQGEDDEVMQSEGNPFSLADGVEAKSKDKAKKSKISSFFNSFYKTASEKQADALREAQEQQEEERERLSSRQKSSEQAASGLGFAQPDAVGAVSERSDEESHVDSDDDDGFN